MTPLAEFAAVATIAYLAGAVSAFLLARWAGRPRKRA